MGADDHDITPEEHSTATDAADKYLHDPRSRWPIRLDGHNEENVLLKLNWAKSRTCEFDVVIRDADGAIAYDRQHDGSIMKVGHEVTFKASLSAFVPNSAASASQANGTGPAFSVSYTVRGMTLLRRAPAVTVIKIDISSVDVDDADLTPL